MPSFYEENPEAFSEAVKRKAFEDRLLAGTGLDLFIASDPDNEAQATAKRGLLDGTDRLRLRCQSPGGPPLGACCPCCQSGEDAIAMAITPRAIALFEAKTMPRTPNQAYVCPTCTRIFVVKLDGMKPPVHTDFITKVQCPDFTPKLVDF